MQVSNLRPLPCDDCNRCITTTHASAATVGIGSGIAFQLISLCIFCATHKAVAQQANLHGRQAGVKNALQWLIYRPGWAE